MESGGIKARRATQLKARSIALQSRAAYQRCGGCPLPVLQEVLSQRERINMSSAGTAHIYVPVGLTEHGLSPEGHGVPAAHSHCCARTTGADGAMTTPTGQPSELGHNIYVCLLHALHALHAPESEDVTRNRRQR
ncbi:hypothetical protein SKAU_G00333860 [Synaphobranchus kaupii]|uniref:Uncharacterized protein n=1 Tax=Synaphobranchus kaupii TaxID=118154 RepID=A0A9Q1ELV0_SYNKA|nr:hypothetical protein SKAU_G00333860 [Synaphobranchus kaupii]